MAICTAQNVFDTARSHLSDNIQVPTGESFPNAVLQPQFAEPYRDMFRCLMGASKRVQRVVYVVLPAYTTVLNPAAPPYLITDLAEPEMVEQRPASVAIPIASTDTSTPINVTTASPHGLGTGVTAAGQISGTNGSTAPWGNWFVTVTGPTTFSLNGSMSDGAASTGGVFYGQSNQPFIEIGPIDLSISGLDGTPQTLIDSYLWINEQFQFRGASQNTQLRITYYASGTPPASPSTNINIDDCLDFLAVATAANAANSKGWFTMSDRLRERAYGDGGATCSGGLLGKFINIQVLALQRGPTRRQLPFRDKRSKFGNYIFG